MKEDNSETYTRGSLEGKSGKRQRGIFFVAKNLAGSGSDAGGINDQSFLMSELILGAAKQQLQLETGKNISLFPAELLADKFVSEDLDRYSNDLEKFLKHPKYFKEDDFENVKYFVHEIQENKTPCCKMHCGNRLWRFYKEYLNFEPHIPTEPEQIFKHLVETILEEGFSRVFLNIGGVSEFMKNRSEELRRDDEETLDVLSNRLRISHHLPIWTVYAG
jgi:hypothetical protein